jgi:RNA polymerase sigma-70 factor (ECF subfamily)
MMGDMPAASSGAPASGEAAASRSGPTGADLADLLRRSARGDEAAFAALYDATARRIYGLVLRIVRDPAMSEEVTQEVYLDVWRHCARFDPERGSAISWLMTIAHRTAVDRVRASEASRRRDDVHAATTADIDFDTTAESAQASLEAQRVRRALTTLTDAQRSAVELAYLGGYTHTEVARLLDLPLGTAKTRIRDGLIRLRDTLGVPA